MVHILEGFLLNAYVIFSFSVTLVTWIYSASPSHRLGLLPSVPPASIYQGLGFSDLNLAIIPHVLLIHVKDPLIPSLDDPSYSLRVQVLNGPF